MHGDIKTGAEYVRALDGYTRELRDPELFDPNTYKLYYTSRNQVL